MARSMAILVHGFTGSQANWERLTSLASADPEVSQRFELRPFTYPTALLKVPLKRRLPAVDEAANSLAAYIDSPDLYGREITLVGHSQGGLVILECLRHIMEKRGAAALSPIRQVVLFATPHQGSMFLSGARRVLFRLFPNPQERDLRVLAPRIAELERWTREKIAGARSQGSDQWPIPIQCFWGMQDNVVRPESAQGAFWEGTALEGDHSTIIQPRDAADPRYAEFKEALLHPLGHPSVFEVADYQMLVRVEPVDARKRFPVTHGRRTRTVRTDNIAHVRRRVTFSQKNRCRELFRLQYGTEEGGGLRPVPSHPNEAPPQEILQFEQYGLHYVFGFRPDSGQTYGLDLEVYKGFDKGNRDVHIHLNRDSHFQRVFFELDLSAYGHAGHKIAASPRLHLRPVDPGDHAWCTGPAAGDLVEPTASGSDGVWHWEMTGLRQGVVDVRFEETLAGRPRARTRVSR